MDNRALNTSAFSCLANRLRAVASGREPEVIRRAVSANRWFTPDDIGRAAVAIAERMLDPAKLTSWAGRYSPAARQKNVAVIMAGNIPMAGMFDLVCVLMSGHRCLVKNSSKDTVLMQFAVGVLLEQFPLIPVETYAGQTPDAVIASGSDNAIRHLRASFARMPAIMRGNRASAAVLTGGETGQELSGLAEDIFSYSGLGCRNVSHLLLPEGYPLEKLTRLPYPALNPKYLNNYRQRKAVLSLSGEEFTDCGYYLLRRDDGFPAALSEITYRYYSDPKEITEWITANENQVQCVVAGGPLPVRLPFEPVPFGCAQSPGLTDYPDRIDTMRFLENLR